MSSMKSKTRAGISQEDIDFIEKDLMSSGYNVRAMNLEDMVEVKNDLIQCSPHFIARNNNKIFFVKGITGIYSSDELRGIKRWSMEIGEVLIYFVDEGCITESVWV